MLKRYGEKTLEESAARAKMNLRRRTVTMTPRSVAGSPLLSASSQKNTARTDALIGAAL
jgi:hypothetical protein